MLKTLVLNGWTPEHATRDCDIALNVYRSTTHKIQAICTGVVWLALPRAIGLIIT